MDFKNEVEPGVLQSSVQKTYVPQECQIAKIELRQFQCRELCAFGILAACMFVECWTGVFKVRPRFRTVQIAW